MGEKNTKENKLTYEQLEAVASQLTDKVRYYERQLQESNREGLFIRLNYLFKVVKLSSYFSDTFVKDCIKEIEDLMTIPKEEEK